MSRPLIKITDLCWANTTDLEKPEWKNCAIQSPYWSRKWEYPFVLSKMNPQDSQVVCDAGSGNMNPLPVYLGATYPSSTIYAVDLDPSPFPDTKQIKTLQEDLTKTSIVTSSVDTVVCISVLEHMQPEQWMAGMQEFCRILKPGGKVVVTLDVEAEAGCAYHFKTPELYHFIRTIDPTARIPARPADLLTSLSGTLPGEKDLHPTVIGFVAEVQ